MENRLIENVDYYFNEEGLMVFTKQYHLDRGYCCGNGCLHCPYNFEAVQQPLRSQLLEERNVRSNSTNEEE